MKRTQFIHGARIIVMTVGHLLLSLLFTAGAAQVTLTWDANETPPEGYRLYQRQEGEQNFTQVWSGPETIHTIDGLIEETTYFFIVRAFEGALESDNSNLLEYTPSASSASDDSDANGSPNRAPDTPQLDQPENGATRVGLTPTLKTKGFTDGDQDLHAQTWYQISTSADFKNLVFGKRSSEHLTELNVPHLILEPDSSYYWRVKFIDDQDSVSRWSQTRHFITIDHAAAGDLNGDGILDSQEIEGETDIDANGVNDSDQAGFQGIQNIYDDNAHVGLKRMDQNAQIGSVLALNADQLASTSNRPDQLTHVISFKLYLAHEATSATVKVYFAEPAPSDALWYKYDLDEGWVAYSQAVFDNDRKSVTLVLEDGGIGDHDGVKNGIIVDPAGLGYTSISDDPWGSTGTGCFVGGIQAGSDRKNHPIKTMLILISIGLLLQRRKRRP